MKSDLCRNNGTINHIDLILSGVHIHSMIHVSCKFDNDFQIFNKATVIILVKGAKTALNQNRYKNQTDGKKNNVQKISQMRY